MNGESIVQGILLAFAVVVVMMPAFIRLLRRLGMGKRIRMEGPETHYVKEGTPTMGGLLIVGVVLGVGLLVELAGGDFVDSSTFAPMATLALVGVLGTADDWLNARTGDGISATQKLLWQSVVAGVAAWQIQDTYQITALFAPFIGVIEHPALALHPHRRLRHRGHQQRRQHHRRARRPGRRDAHLRLHRLHGHRGRVLRPWHGWRRCRRGRPATPLRAHHRGPAGLPLVQRASGADLHGRLRRPGPGCHAGRHRAHHRAGPAAAAHRPRLRAGDRLRRSSRSAP